MASKAETNYQRGLIIRLERMLPGCMILKNDPRQLQGVPDLLVIYNKWWGALEVKTDSGRKEPNQEHYVTKMNQMSFASFISPSTESEVFRAIQRSIRSRN